MNNQDAVLDPAYLNLNGTFDEQVEQLLMRIRLSRYQVECLYELYDDLEETLERIWPGCKINPFGSIITGLGVQTSDVDCYVELPIQFRSTHNNHVIAARNLLRMQPVFRDVFAIPNAKVPIVKFYHIPTDRNCDVSFKGPSGVRNSKLIQALLHMDRRALNLAIIIKYWGKIHKLTGTNFMSNYTLTILVIFFLQIQNILPSVNWLQAQSRSNFVDNWNTAFSDILYVSDNEDSLYNILGDFFAFYSNFNYQEKLISPFLGVALEKVLFKRLCDVPDSFFLYKENVRKGLCQPIRLDSAICVQDPFDHSRNCASAVYARLATNIIGKFKDGAQMYRQMIEKRFLKSIFIISEHDKQLTTKKNNKLSKIIKRKPNAYRPQIKNHVRHDFRTQFRYKHLPDGGNFFTH